MPAEIATYTLAIGRAMQRGIVHQKHHIVGTQFGIAFKHAITMLSPFAKSRQSVFWGKCAGTAVGNPARVRPGVCAVDGHKRFPVSALK
jgi:hypothetical protein